MRYNIGSVTDLREQDGFIDKQAWYITRQAINGVQFVLVAGVRMHVSEALEESNPEQRQRALANINAQLQS